MVATHTGRRQSIFRRLLNTRVGVAVAMVSMILTAMGVMLSGIQVADLFGWIQRSKTPAATAQPLPLHSQKALARLVRGTLDIGKEPTVEDAAVRQFITQNNVMPDIVRMFLSQLAVRARSAANDVDLGRDLAKQRNLSGARAAFLRATQTDPENAYAWANLGAVEALLGKDHDAYSAYQRALDVSPENWLAHYNLSCLLARQGKREEALSHVGRAVEQLKRTNSSEAALRSALDKIRGDSSLAAIRDDPRFQRILHVD